MVKTTKKTKTKTTKPKKRDDYPCVFEWMPHGKAPGLDDRIMAAVQAAYLGATRGAKAKPQKLHALHSYAPASKRREYLRVLQAIERDPDLAAAARIVAAGEVRVDAIVWHEVPKAKAVKP